METIRLAAAEALVRFLTAQRTELADGTQGPLFPAVFAIFGHGNVTSLGEALYRYRADLPTVRGQNEQGMALAGAAYAKAARRRQIPVATSSIGPGALNMVTAAGVAHANRLPLLLLSGDTFASRVPDPVLQQLEHFDDPTRTANDAFRAVVRYWDRITKPEQLLASLPQAVATMLDPADCGPAFLGLPQDVQAEAHDWPEPAIRLVDEGYVSTMRVPVVAGRAFRASDDASSPPVVLVNEEAQLRYFAGRDPIGQRIRLWGAERSVVGVLGGERVRGQAEAAPPAVYLPTGQSPVGSGSILVRTAGDPATLAEAVRQVIHGVDPEVPLFGIEPLARTLSNSAAERRFVTVVLGAFAGLALLLAIVGVHGVLSYTVARRTREIGIRMALGADRARVRSLVLGEGATLVGLGLLLGILGAVGLSQVLRSMLFGVGRNDPVTLAGVAVLLGGVALLASVLPAWRAARVDPIVALRTE